MRSFSVVVLVLWACGCGAGSGDVVAVDAPVSDEDGRGLDGGGPDGGGLFALPPLNGGLDYQLGGAYAPPAGVNVVSRDREAAPAAGLYNICYVNGFQVQIAEEAAWMTPERMGLLLRNGGGQLVRDPVWREIVIDIRTPEKRAQVAAIVGGWIAGCKQAGFDAIEIDNLDSYSRSVGLITEDDAVATMALFSAAAHGQSMAIAQKNSSEIAGRKSEMATDFAVTEECNRFDECGVYVGAYGDHVLVIEYRRQDFTVGCAQWGNRLSIVLRDVDLVPQGASGYVFEGC
jgi:Glycoside-hydrolase family GH114